MDDLEQLIGYTFKNPTLLQEALTHPSLSYETQRRQADNQRLEFLGDAVLQLVVTSKLFERHQDLPEGGLTKLRSSLVSRTAIAAYAKQLKLGGRLLMGKGEESSGGREKASSLADAFEALLGAVYVDSGYEETSEVILRLLKIPLEQANADSVFFNPKGQLQEILQSRVPEAPTYEIIREEGPDHAKKFIARVLWQGIPLGEGAGASKKHAESEAARNALDNPQVQKMIENLAAEAAVEDAE